MRSDVRYPTVSTVYWRWIQSVSEALIREARRLPDEELRASLIERAIAMTRCIRRVVGHYCKSCRAPAPRSGQLRGLRSLKGGGSCRSRSCPRCARRRSAALRHWAETLQENLRAMGLYAPELGADFRLRLVTLTSVYDPSDEADLTVEALRERWAGLRAAWREIWASVRDEVINRDTWTTRPATEVEAKRRRKNRRIEHDNGSWSIVVRDREAFEAATKRAMLLGAWSAVELAGTGHVHLHVLYFGPWVDLHAPDPDCRKFPGASRPGWVDIGRRVFPRLGDVSDVRIANVDTVAELAKYPIKGLGVGSFDWLAGDEPASDRDGRGVLVHPVLAARWEAALHGRRVGDLYGSFRSVPDPEEIDTDEEGEEPEAPCRCGAHNWARVECELRDWARWCRSARVEPLGAVRVVRRQ